MTTSRTIVAWAVKRRKNTSLGPAQWLEPISPLGCRSFTPRPPAQGAALSVIVFARSLKMASLLAVVL